MESLETKVRTDTSGTSITNNSRVRTARTKASHMQYPRKAFKGLLTYLGVVLLACSGSSAQTSGSGGHASSTSSSRSLVLGKAAATLQEVGTSPTPKHSVSLSWKASTSSGVRYNVYRRALTGDPLKVNSDPIPDTTYIDPSVQAGQTYFYTAKAIDSRGTPSVTSNEVKVVIPSP
jgi:hypothetical protein